jgi:hypothetical protein
VDINVLEKHGVRVFRVEVHRMRDQLYDVGPGLYSASEENSFANHHFYWPRPGFVGGRAPPPPHRAEKLVFY